MVRLALFEEASAAGDDFTNDDMGLAQGALPLGFVRAEKDEAGGAHMSGEVRKGAIVSDEEMAGGKEVECLAGTAVEEGDVVSEGLAKGFCWAGVIGRVEEVKFVAQEALGELAKAVGVPFGSGSKVGARSNGDTGLRWCRGPGRGLEIDAFEGHRAHFFDEGEVVSDAVNDGPDFLLDDDGVGEEFLESLYGRSDALWNACFRKGDGGGAGGPGEGFGKIPYFLGDLAS